ncbi:MAG: helix-turn-helix transcriptional regulator [Bacteroidota bacterium]
MNNLAVNLKLIRKKRWNMSQERFAELLNSSRSKINSYENGGIEPSIEFMIRLQGLTGISIRDIFYSSIPLEDIPQAPLEVPDKDIVNEDLINYEIENITELVDYDQKIKKRFRNIEERITDLEGLLKPPADQE